MKKNILIVDDSPSLRKVIRNYLEGVPDVQFFEAGDGGEALAIVQEQAVMGEPIRLVVLDWMMPDTSGYEFLASVRSIEQFVESPMIMMLTAETYPEQVSAVMKYNVTAYLMKPFTREDIFSAVSKAFEGAKDAI